MEEKLLLTVPSAVVLMMLIYLYIINRKSSLQSKDSNLGQKAPLLRERNQTSLAIFHCVLLLCLILVILILAPWILFYVRSGARLNYINLFFTLLFVISLVIIPILSFYVRRGKWR